MSEELFTVYRLSKLLDVDRHMLPRILHRYKVEPATRDAATKLYTLESASDAVRRYKAEPETQGTEANYKTEVARERARKLKIENDIKEGLYMEKKAAVAMFQKVFAGMNQIRVRSIQERPKQFAEAGSSIPENTEELVALWEEIMGQTKHLKDFINGIEGK